MSHLIEGADKAIKDLEFIVNETPYTPEKWFHLAAIKALKTRLKFYKAGTQVSELPIELFDK